VACAGAVMMSVEDGRFWRGVPEVGLDQSEVTPKLQQVGRVGNGAKCERLDAWRAHSFLGLGESILDPAWLYGANRKDVPPTPGGKQPGSRPIASSEFA